MGSLEAFLFSFSLFNSRTVCSPAPQNSKNKCRSEPRHQTTSRKLLLFSTPRKHTPGRKPGCHTSGAVAEIPPGQEPGDKRDHGRRACGSSRETLPPGDHRDGNTGAGVVQRSARHPRPLHSVAQARHVQHDIPVGDPRRTHSPNHRWFMAARRHCPNMSCKNFTDNVVYANKTNCPICGTEKPPPPEGPPPPPKQPPPAAAPAAPAGPPGQHIREPIPGARPGDWHCPNEACKNHTGNVVYGSKSYCPLCGTDAHRCRSPPIDRSHRRCCLTLVLTIPGLVQTSSYHTTGGVISLGALERPSAWGFAEAHSQTLAGLALALRCAVRAIAGGPPAIARTASTSVGRLVN